MVKTKVFCGNLSFNTTEADLRREFEVAGKVETANIITRGSRSLGYGFVEMGSLEEANKSVELLHKKNIDNREINVEVARPREDKPPAAPRQPREPREPRPAGEAAAGGEAADGSRPRGRVGRGRGPRGPRGPRAPRADGTEGSPAAAGAAPGSPNPAGARPPRQPRAPRAPRAPRPDQGPRTPSTNTLYVANLPFSVDDAKLSEIFAGLNIKQAHVVRKPNDRSKGFGFVEFNNEEDQRKALESVSKKVVEGRELTVKVALTELPRDLAAAAGTSSPSVAASGSTAPAGSASPATSAPAASTPAQN